LDEIRFADVMPFLFLPDELLKVPLNGVVGGAAAQ
jgi:hypothetical protein